MQDTRPDPDRILHQIQQQEADAAHVRGRLKIFFGYAAGVGKTYAMLEAAHAAKDSGVDVREPTLWPDTSSLTRVRIRSPCWRDWNSCLRCAWNTKT